MVYRGVEISGTDALLVLTVIVDIKESALLPSRATMVNGIIEFHCVKVKKTKGNGAYEPKAQTAGAYTSFISMKHLVVLLLPPLDGMLVHRRVIISGMLPVPIYTLGRQRETKKQRGKPGNSGRNSNGTLPSGNFPEKK